MSGPEEKGPLPPFDGWRPSQPLQPRHIRRVWTYAVAAVVVIAAVIVLSVILFRRPPPTPAPVAGPVPDTNGLSEHYVVSSGEVMATVLARAGIDAATAATITQALRTGGFNFRRMRPGDSLVLTRRMGELRTLEYRKSFERIYRLDFESGDCRVSMVLPRIRRIAATVEGGISSSLYEALLELGEKPALIADYADIFGWEVDFFCETQENDSFLILVDRKLVDSAVIGYGHVIAARYHGQVGDIRAFRFTDPDGHTDYYNEAGQSLRKTFLKSPLRFSRITSYFGSRYHPIRRIRCRHHGIDYAAPRGTPVSCVADGRVTIAAWTGGYGKLVEVSHSSGLRSRYGHLKSYARGIKAGATVTQGQTVGYVGSTGMSTGPHLHYEIRRNGSPINPLRMNVPRAEPVKNEYLPAFEATRDSILEVIPGLAPVRLPQPQDQTPS